MNSSHEMQWDAIQYDQQHSFVHRLGLSILELLDPQPGERILDVGCGTGHLTSFIAEKGAFVVGIDSCEEMIAKAKTTYSNLELLVGDIRDFRAKEPFDAIFSNAVLHWVQPPEQAVIRMSELLRPGGRLVVEFGGYGNVARICTALEEAVLACTGTVVSAINYFPKLSQYTTLLEQHGFEVTLARLFDRPTQLDGGNQGLENWLSLFRKPIMDVLTPTDRQRVLDQVHHSLREELYRDGSWFADYRRLKIVANRLIPSSTAVHDCGGPARGKVMVNEM